MKTIKKLSLNKLNREELENREMSFLLGGQSCGCGCNYIDYGGSNIYDNRDANIAGGLYSTGGSNLICTTVKPNGDQMAVASF